MKCPKHNRIGHGVPGVVTVIDSKDAARSRTTAKNFRDVGCRKGGRRENGTRIEGVKVTRKLSVLFSLGVRPFIFRQFLSHITGPFNEKTLGSIPVSIKNENVQVTASLVDQKLSSEVKLNIYN